MHSMDDQTSALASAIGSRVRQERLARRGPSTASRRPRGEPTRRGQRRAGRHQPERRHVAEDERRARGRPAGLGRATQGRPVTITRAGEGATLWTGEWGGRGVLVAGTGPPDVLELWNWTLEAGEQHVSEAHTPGTQELLRTWNAGDSRPQIADGPSRSAPETRSPSPATWSTATPTRAGSLLGSPWPCSSPTSALHEVAESRTPRHRDLETSSLAPRSTLTCSSCDPTIARCSWRSTASARGRATRRARLLLEAAEAAAAYAGRPARGGPAARRGLAGGLPGVRREAAAHPHQPRGAPPPCRPGPAAGQPADRPLQRGLGPPPGAGRRRGPEPVRRAAAAGARDRLTNRSTPSPTDRGRRAPRPRRGGVVRRRRGDLSPLELAPGTTYPAADDTTAALFILDALDPMTDDALMPPATTWWGT